MGIGDRLEAIGGAADRVVETLRSNRDPSGHRNAASERAGLLEIDHGFADETGMNAQTTLPHSARRAAVGIFPTPPGPWRRRRSNRATLRAIASDVGSVPASAIWSSGCSCSMTAVSSEKGMPRPRARAAAAD